MDVTEKISVPTIGSQERRGMRWVDPSFQRRYAFLLLSIVLLVSTVLIGTFWFHSQQVLNTMSSAGVLKQHSLYMLIEKQMGSLLWSVCIVVGLFCAFVFLMANFLSHRIVGPLYAIKKSLERIGAGDFQGARLKLRTDDEFQDVAELINHTIDRIEK